MRCSSLEGPSHSRSWSIIAYFLALGSRLSNLQISLRFISPKSQCISKAFPATPTRDVWGPLLTIVHMFSLKALIFSLLTAIAGVLYYSYTSLSYSPPCHNSGVSAPRSVSWKIWLGSSPTPCIGNDDDWSLHHHLGGYGPWVSKLTGEPEPHELDPLDGCSIDQIHMVFPSYF